MLIPGITAPIVKCTSQVHIPHAHTTYMRVVTEGKLRWHVSEHSFSVPTMYLGTLALYKRQSSPPFVGLPAVQLPTAISYPTLAPKQNWDPIRFHDLIPTSNACNYMWSISPTMTHVHYNPPGLTRHLGWVENCTMSPIADRNASEGGGQ